MRVLTLSTHGQLRAQVQYLRAENQILRSRIEGPVLLSAHDRARLVKLARPLGSAIREIVSNAKPDTLRRWINQSRARRSNQRAAPRTRHPRRTPEEIRALILNMARETTWGLTRLRGELGKLRCAWANERMSSSPSVPGLLLYDVVNHVGAAIDVRNSTTRRPAP